MNELLTAMLMAWAAGITAFAGGGVAWVERVRESEGKREVIHGVVAFGGGRRRWERYLDFRWGCWGISCLADFTNGTAECA